MWQALQGLSSTPLDELGEEVVDLADVVLVPSRCALHRHHWMVYQALLLLATTAQTRLQDTPRSGLSQPVDCEWSEVAETESSVSWPCPCSPLQTSVDKTLAWLEAACCVCLVSTLRACLPPLPFPDLASRLLAASTALKRLEQAATNPLEFLPST